MPFVMDEFKSKNENEFYIWKTFYKQNFDKYGRKLILECNLKESDCTLVCKNKVFVRIILTAWCKINQNETQVLWNNSDIKCSNNILYYKQWQEKCIKYIEHISKIKAFYNFEACMGVPNIPYPLK